MSTRTKFQPSSPLTWRFVLGGAVLASLAACAIVETGRYFSPDTLPRGFSVDNVGVSHARVQWVVFSGDGARQLECLDPKGEYALGSNSLAHGEFVEELVEDPSDSSVVWAILGTPRGAVAVPTNQYCDLDVRREIALPAPEPERLIVPAGYDIDADGNHYALLHGEAWWVGRYDATDGAWTVVEVGDVPWIWDGTPVIDGVRLSFDPYADRVVVGNREQILLAPGTLAVTSTRRLAVPLGYHIRDAVSSDDMTLAILRSDRGLGDRVVLFDRDGRLDTTDAEIDFEWAEKIMAQKATMDVGHVSPDSCGEVLKFEVLGQRAGDTDDHNLHQFWRAAVPCDPYADGDAGF